MSDQLALHSRQEDQYHIDALGIYEAQEVQWESSNKLPISTALSRQQSL